MSDTVCEDDMRQQMFQTMISLERMAEAVTSFLTADRRPPERSDGTSQISDEGGDVHIKGNLIVDGNIEAKKDLTSYGCVSSVESSYEDSSKLDELGKVISKHHRALGMIASFGMMKDKPAFGTEPARAIANLLGMQACKNCVGTGWVARDETCGECDRSGYIRV